MVITRSSWADTVSDQERLSVETRALPFASYKENVSRAKRPEELGDEIHAHIWEKVNKHPATEATSFPELIKQMDVAHFGHRPKVADVFCGSGQIPFEAARLGCDVYASDLNPVACMLTWGAMNIVMSDNSKANNARLKLSIEFKGSMMSGDGEIAATPLLAILYALFELSRGVEVDDVLLHLMDNFPNYLPNKTLMIKMADYLAEKREGLKTLKTFKPDVEASCARILAEAMRNQRL